MIWNLKYKKIQSYCLKCEKNIVNVNPRVSKTSHGKTMLLSKCLVLSRFTKEQEESVLLNSLGIKTPLSKILSFGNILFWLFWMQFHNDLIVIMTILIKKWME